MNKTHLKLVPLALAGLLGFGGTAQAADIVIGKPNWTTVAITAHVLETIIEDNFGLEVDIQDGTNPIVFEAMDAGSMHVHPEVWLPNQQNLHDKFVKDKGTVRANPNGVPGPQNMCVTKGTVERTGIKALAELADPDMAKQFDRNGDGKGEIWVGAAGWASTNVEKIRAKSYGYAETLELVEMDETLALAEVDASITKGENIVFFCYQPHHMFELWELVALEEPPYDEAKWKVIQPTDDPDWLAKSDAPVAWNTAFLHIHYATELEKSHPEVAEFLSKVKLDPAAVSGWAYAATVEGKSQEDVAKDFVANNTAAIDSWLN